MEHGYDPMECKSRLDCIFVQNAPPYLSIKWIPIIYERKISGGFCTWTTLGDFVLLNSPTPGEVQVNWALLHPSTIPLVSRGCPTLGESLWHVH